MKLKTIKIIYWSVTILFCLANLFSGISGFFQNQQGLDVMKHLGYPAYLLLILGVAKTLGSVVVVQTKFRTIKEWAYAGFAIDYIGASASHLITGDAFSALFPIIFLAVMFISYFFWKKVEQIKNGIKKRVAR